MNNLYASFTEYRIAYEKLISQAEFNYAVFFGILHKGNLSLKDFYHSKSPAAWHRNEELRLCEVILLPKSPSPITSTNFNTVEYWSCLLDLSLVSCRYILIDLYARTEAEVKSNLIVLNPQQVDSYLAHLAEFIVNQEKKLANIKALYFKGEYSGVLDFLPDHTFIALRYLVSDSCQNTSAPVPFHPTLSARQIALYNYYGIIKNELETYSLRNSLQKKAYEAEARKWGLDSGDSLYHFDIEVREKLNRITDPLNGLKSKNKRIQDLQIVIAQLKKDGLNKAANLAETELAASIETELTTK